MKKSFTKIGFYLLMAFAVIGLTTSCSSDDDDTPPPAPEELVLNGSLSSEKILLTGYTYKLDKGFHVKSGGNLIIQKGVTIQAQENSDDPDYILIEQGGKITAEGTKDQPIVMTSKTKSHGAWGGVHICGKAPINLNGGSGKSEIGDANYGGNVANDNSGVMRYVRLEYTGFAFNPDKESNGLTMYGVGNGTTIEYVQVYKGADDGFEWFGGTVNSKFLVSTGSGDDSFDWTEGWIGKGQFWVAVQDADGDCLIEADNLKDNNMNTPISSPTIANLTLIGNNSTESKRGVRLREGTHVKMYNALICGKESALTTETTGTEQSFTDGKSFVEYTHVSTVFKTGSSLDLKSATGNAEGQTINFTNTYLGSVDGGKDLSSDSFFTKAMYKGAVPADNDWTAGWTKK
ncbi:hypothetical protein D0T56_00100 [Dysgonomonas sp. 520]|nr:hypothetical protein [Dysgonomonas sp. 520]NDW08063.1 hypothetical protein [Dysgonomonas sp. 520]